jgi:RNA recognition motif-containing protein
MRIYVGNLSYSTTEQKLRAAFEAFGAVDEVSIPTDRDSGRPRGFGFVTMADDGQATAAIAGVNGSEVDGRAVRVNEAQPRK